MSGVAQKALIWDSLRSHRKEFPMSEKHFLEVIC